MKYILWCICQKSGVSRKITKMDTKCFRKNV